MASYLIIHRMIDDNVSVRDAMRFVEALQMANKDFELMIYAGSRTASSARVTAATTGFIRRSWAVRYRPSRRRLADGSEYSTAQRPLKFRSGVAWQNSLSHLGLRLAT